MGDFMHLVIFLVSIALFSIGAYRLNKYKSLNKWIKLKANISSVKEQYKDVALSEYTTVKYFYPEISYDYIVNNHSYTSSSVSSNIENIWVCEVDNFGVETKDKNMFWRALKNTDVIDVYINPKNPEESVIITAFSTTYKSHNLALIISGILIFLLWLYLKQITV